MADIEKTDLRSKDLINDRSEKLQGLLPEAFPESGIDFDKLRILLGNEVDKGLERYAFTWPGKTGTIRQSQTVSTATPRPRLERNHSRNGKDGSFDSDNIYIKGDSLEMLKLLQRGYHGEVKTIYIDPPYNTGRDFAYKDKPSDTIESYEEQAGLTGQSNAETSGRYHSDRYSMTYPQLKLARGLLSDDGIIFISIDDNEDRNLRILCDEVFGEPNFVAQPIWERTFSPKNDAKFVSNSCDCVLVYARNIRHFMIGRLPYTETANARYTNPDSDPRGPQMSDNMAVKTYSESTDYPITTPSGRVVESPVRRCWRLSRNAFCERLQDSRIWFGVNGNGVPQIKHFLCEVDGRGTAPASLLFYKKVGHSQEGTEELVSLFDGKSYFGDPRPTRLLQCLMTLINLSNNDTVFDFFSSSASMAHSVFKQEIERGTDYYFMLVQLLEGADPKREAYRDGYATLCNIGRERTRRAGNEIKSDLNESNCQLVLGEGPRQFPDTGFRVFTLNDFDIEKPQPDKLVHEMVKPNHIELDIVFEMMPKWGLELALPVEKSGAADYSVWSVTCDKLVCCMSLGLIVEAPEAIADMGPKCVLILDSIPNDALKLNAVQIFKRVSEYIGTDIELRTA